MAFDRTGADNRGEANAKRGSQAIGGRSVLSAEPPRGAPVSGPRHATHSGIHGALASSGPPEMSASFATLAREGESPLDRSTHVRGSPERRTVSWAQQARAIVPRAATDR